MLVNLKIGENIKPKFEVINSLNTLVCNEAYFRKFIKTYNDAGLDRVILYFPVKEQIEEYVAILNRV